ncbi:HTH-type transcriptional activator Btr [compost metagenome]
MAAPAKHIPVKSLSKKNGCGIIINKLASNSLPLDEGIEQPHRHDHHVFVLQEKGESHMEIDFEKYSITTPSIFYQSPNQVHRGLKIEHIELYVMVINTENIADEYRRLLTQISPAKPLTLNPENLELIRLAFALCADLYNSAKDALYFPILKNSCNTVIALIISQYLKQSKPTDKLSRFDIIAQAFTELLENNFTSFKRPADYAEKLNISAPYLNECIKQVTGFSVSHQIQQRIILEAKRHLYHSNRSIKEIATELGYEDYAYFSRLFAKATGITAMAFRSKNHD